jgi:hypothetical protein
MLFELLKNSLRAVVETTGVDADEFPAIKIIVAEGKEDIAIKISDEGGGIPRSGLKMVWVSDCYSVKLYCKYSLYGCRRICTPLRKRPSSIRTLVSRTSKPRWLVSVMVYHCRDYTRDTLVVICG